MFHDGDLQSGIAIAIQQNKTVACFVRDHQAESAQWENEWLQGSETCQTLQSKAVVLRIQAGSQEAGFLSAFCPVDKVPALVIIRNGQLLDSLVAGLSNEEFDARIQKAFDGTTQPSTASLTTASASQPIEPASAPTDTIKTTTEPSSAPSSVRQERETQTSKSKGKQKQVEPPPPDPSPPTTDTAAQRAARNDWLEQQKHRKSEARRERERVMAQIEADKAERRARREEEKLARAQQAAEQATTPTQTSPTSRIRRSNATSSNLQIRLLDGATIRKQFPADASLETDVRPWIDTHLESKMPYTFKQILAPQPARAISTGEEHGTLRDLDLLPSATLVLQPIQTFTDAYEGNTGGLMSLPYNAVTGVFGLVSGTLSGAANWLRGGLFRPEDDDGGRTLNETLRQHETPRQEQPAPRANPTSKGNIRVRTLADQRDGSAEQKFYNGNSLDFAPNPEDGSSTKKD